MSALISIVVAFLFCLHDFFLPQYTEPNYAQRKFLGYLSDRCAPPHLEELLAELEWQLGDDEPDIDWSLHYRGGSRDGADETVCLERGAPR